MGLDKFTIAHVINSFSADEKSDLYFAQPVTFETMRIAKQKLDEPERVQQFVCFYEEDRESVPKDFIQLPPLEYSVLDFQNMSKSVKLPLIREVLKKLYDNTQSEYLIYSNVDIALYPDFYKRVFDLINQGYDSIIINRRRIPDYYRNLNEIDQMIKLKGKSHPGFDCFIFHRSLYPKMVLENICIGVPFFEISFSQNIFALAQRYQLIDRERLTFHIGMEIFKKRQPKEYIYYNRNEYYKIIDQLKDHLSSKKFPYYHSFFLIRWIKWAIHPCIPIRLAMNLELNTIKK